MSAAEPSAGSTSGARATGDAPPIDRGAARRFLAGPLVPPDALAVPGAGEGGTIGGHRVLGALGRGAAGTVLLAHDPALDRRVAIKVLERIEDPEAIVRFEREGRWLASFEHPYLLDVLDAGLAPAPPACEPPPPYLVLEYLDGATLAERAADLDRRARVETLACVADAVGFLHGEGIVHRDLKPTNVLMTATGRPRVGDLGLARDLGSAARLTASSIALGTPAFMAPEQLRGSFPVGPPADVWALGAILHWLLVDRLPFRNPHENPHDDPATSPPPRPFDEDPTVPRDLDTIVRGCLRSDPRRRYPDANAVRADLDRWLEGLPARGPRPPGLLTTMGIGVLAYLGTIVLLAVIVALLVGLFRAPGATDGDSRARSGRSRPCAWRSKAGQCWFRGNIVPRKSRRRASSDGRAGRRNKPPSRRRWAGRSCGCAWRPG